jgi:hypothetical protein
MRENVWGSSDGRSWSIPVIQASKTRWRSSSKGRWLPMGPQPAMDPALGRRRDALKQGCRQIAGIKAQEVALQKAV